MKYTNIFTSESVGEGHPDKVADLISDSILDACLAQDPTSRVACETLVKDNHVVLAGEITTKAVIDYEKIVRDTIAEIGYRTAADDALFNAENVDITNYLSTQSPDIAQGVDACEAEGKEGAEQGAGDQGIMFGFASNETPELMPAPIMFSHRIMMELAKVRHSGVVTWLRPDSKSQVAVEYGDNGRPARILNVVLSTQHTEEVDIATIREFCTNLIRRCLPTSSPPKLSSSSTPPAASSSVAPTVTPASPAARLSWIPTAAWAATAAAPSPARTAARWTAPAPTCAAGWPSTWLPPAWPTAASSRWATPSARPAPSPS